MNIGELKKLIADIPNDVEVFAEGHGHEMVKVSSAKDWKVAYNRVSRNFWQYFDDEAVQDDEVVVRALVIDG